MRSLLLAMRGFLILDIVDHVVTFGHVVVVEPDCISENHFHSSVGVYFLILTRRKS